MQGIELARIIVAAMCCGMLESALSVALDATRDRHAFGRAIGDFQGIQWMLADVATELEAAKALAYRAAALVDEGESATLAAHTPRSLRPAWRSLGSPSACRPWGQRVSVVSTRSPGIWRR